VKPTTRQLEIIKLRAEGLPVKEIAELLKISPRTVQNHIAFALSRFALEGRGVYALIKLARERGWIDK
jgi:DNA-binding NarL/FixJ family response regulator